MRLQLKNERGNFFLLHHDLNHGPLRLIASVLPMSFTDSYGTVVKMVIIFIKILVSHSMVNKLSKAEKIREAPFTVL